MAEAGPEPVVRDRPAERTGPRRHGGRAGDPAAGDSVPGWDRPPLAEPGQPPAVAPAAGARATSAQTAYGWTGSGPLPSGLTPPEPARAGRGTEAGFVADPEFDLADRRAAGREPTGWTAGGRASGRSATQPPADSPAGDDVATSRRSRGRAALREGPPGEDQVAPGAGRQSRSPRAARSPRRSGRRGNRRKLIIGAGLAVVVAGAAVVVGTGMLGGNGPAHVLTTPDKLGAYVRRPQLEKQMNAAELQREVVTKSAGQASHVVSAVYEDGTSATSTQPPQMILFIGGNLTGVSAGGFIASFTQQSKGAFVTSAGSLGGAAACVNAQASVPGSVALCTWADNDTFGVVASPTMSATKLATHLRAIRPMVEHVVR